MSPVPHNLIVVFAVWCIALLGPAVLGGCASTQTTSSYDRALAAYQAHRYSTAHSHAVDAIRASAGQQRDEATYIAGLSAYLLGDIDEAELRLSAASRSGNAAVAANAKAMLGQVRMDQNRTAEAERLFREAAAELRGSDAREAERYAAMANGSGDHAGGSGGSWASSGNGSFTLQAGAFSDRRRATSAAEEAQALASRDGLGSVRIVPSSDSRGRTLYLVQFGSFDTRSAAAQARSQIGRLDYIVAPTRQSLTDASSSGW